MKRRITVKEVEHIAFRMAQELMVFDEPIPDFSTRLPNILESCLAAPFQTFDGKFLYPNFLTRASMLFYLMIKNHPFENGNKRIAMTTLFSFLFANNKWLSVNTQVLYNFTIWIAQSLPEVKDDAIRAIERFLRKYLQDIPPEFSN
jgi:prophage maintenance system killer protein